MNKFLILICLFSCMHAHAQNKQAIGNAIALYHLLEGDQSRLYNGTMYRDYSVTLTEGHPYFETKEFSKGTLSYDGLVYVDVPVLYNIVTEDVIIPHFNKVYWISLVNDKITEFKFLGHHFIRHLESSSSDLLRTGFYEQLYGNKVLVWKKTSKFIDESIGSDNKTKKTIRVIHRRYLQKDGVWYKVSSLRSVLNVLNDQKKNIRQYLKKNKLRYRKKPDETLIRIAAYYDVLTR